MADKPVTWVPWAIARSNMPKICSRWSWDSNHADRAFVNVLRLRKVSIRGEAREIEIGSYWGGSRKPIQLQHVVAGLLNVTNSRAEYDRTPSSAIPAFGRLPLHTAPWPTVQKAMAHVSGAELAWEEFCDKLNTYELPDGATQNPDPAGERQRAPYRGALAEWMARKGIRVLRRMTPLDIASDFKGYCETQQRKLLPLLPLRLRSMEGTIRRIINEMEAADTDADANKTPGKGQ